MFDWNDLKYFLAVAQHGSTLSAAKSLRVNQSTVHRRIEELERQLGCALVSRHPTGYRLTEMGEHIRARASRVEAAAADFERAVSAKSSELKGTVKVTCPEALGPRLIASRLIEKFNARYPDVRVEFVMSDKILALGSGDADIAIRGKRPVESGLVGRKIADTPWAVFASRSYVKRHGKIESAAEIDRHSVVVFAGPLKRACSAHEMPRLFIAPNARGCRSRRDSIAALLPSVKSGAGIALMPVVVGKNEKDLVQILDLGAGMATPVYLLTHRDLRPARRAFAHSSTLSSSTLRVAPASVAGAGRPPLRRGSGAG